MARRAQLEVIRSLTRVREAQRDAARWNVARASQRVEQARTDATRLAQLLDAQVEAWRQAASSATVDLGLTRAWASAVVRAQVDVTTGEEALANTKAEQDEARQALLAAENRLTAVAHVARQVGRRLARRDEERALSEASDGVTRRWEGS